MRRCSPPPSAFRRLGSRLALGVLSSQALIDLYSNAYDATDPDQLGESDAWQLRLAFIGKDQDARLSAMRKLWGNAQSPLDRMAAQVLAGASGTASAAERRPPVGRGRPGRLVARRRIRSGSGTLGAGASATWTTSRPTRSGRCWRWARPTPGPLGIDVSRIDDFADRDQSEGKQRTALLIAGLAGLGRIDAARSRSPQPRISAWAWGRDQLDPADRRGDAAAAGRNLPGPRRERASGTGVRRGRADLSFPFGQCAAHAPGRIIWRG